MIDMERIGKFILKLRKFKELTQGELATLLKVSHQAVSKWEKGVALPDTVTLLKIAKQFGVTVDDILAKGMDGEDAADSQGTEALFVRDALNSEEIQRRGIKKAEFFPELVIISEINAKGKTSKKEITAPEGYSVIRGEVFTDGFALNKFDPNGKREQVIPIVNLSYKALHHYIVTYIGKETVELSDQVVVEAYRYSVKVQELDDDDTVGNIWLDDRGVPLLQVAISLKKSSWFCSQKSYAKDKDTGSIKLLCDGQYFGVTNWELNTTEVGSHDIKLDSSLSKRMGGFAMNVDYKVDKDYNPVSYLETWTR